MVSEMTLTAGAGAKNMASRSGTASGGGVHGSGHSASEPNLHHDSSSAAWMETHSEGGWDDSGARGGSATQARGEQQQQWGQQDQGDDFDSWATAEAGAGSRPDSGKASGNFAGFEGLRPAPHFRPTWHALALVQTSPGTLCAWQCRFCCHRRACALCADATWENDEWESSAPAASKASAGAGARKPPAAASRAQRAGSLGAAKKKAEEPPADDDWGKW